MNPYRQAREVENDALGRMTGPSPKEVGWDEGFAAGRAALPDERLREALEGLLDAAAPYLERAHPDEKLWDPPDYHNYQRLAGAIATARALAVTDRDTEGVWPDQSAMHGVLLEQIKDAYAEGIADTLDRIRVRAAEMLPEVARFTLDEIEALAAADRDKEEDER